MQGHWKSWTRQRWSVSKPYPVSWWLELVISLWRPRFVSQLGNSNKNHKLHDKIPSWEKNHQKSYCWFNGKTTDHFNLESQRVPLVSYTRKLAKTQQWVLIECPILALLFSSDQICTLFAEHYQVALRSLESMLEWHEVVFTMALHFQCGTMGYNSRIHRLGAHPNKLEKRDDVDTVRAKVISRTT